MLTSKFRSLLEEYQRKKWFPDLYPDPFGEFIDYVSKRMIDDLFEAWKREKRGSYLNVAYYIAQLLPEVRFRENYQGYRSALLEPISGDLTSESMLYSIRSASEEKAVELWRDLQRWSHQSRASLLEWANVTINVESQFTDFTKAYTDQLKLPAAETERLRSSRDLFAWQLQSRTKANNYRDLLRFFQLDHWNNAADWRALPALAKSVAEACKIPDLPAMKAAKHSATQFLFPILPPKRTLLEYGVASGPYDAMRFLMQLGKSFFYNGMNPELDAEERICGDPSLPWFWGYLFSSLLVDPEGIKNFIGLNAETMTQDTSLILQFWYRHELMLAIYRNQAKDRDQAQELYASLWEVAHPVEPPVFLSLYELCLSAESAYRSVGLLRSQNMITHLRSKYGRRWFADAKWAQRARDYWWEGYRMTTNEILRDQQVPESLNDPF